MPAGPWARTWTRSRSVHSKRRAERIITQILRALLDLCNIPTLLLHASAVYYGRRWRDPFGYAGIFLPTTYYP